MPSIARRRLFGFRERADWTNVKPTVIAPPYIDKCKVLTKSCFKEHFDIYVKYVCQQRLAKSGKGCRSLQDIVLQAILQNISSVNNLDYWPAFLVRRIWELVNKRCILNFHIWKILSRSLSTEPDATLGMLCYRETILCPKLALRCYATPLTSDSLHFISCLSINVQYPLPDLVTLAKMKNLGILEIVNPETMDSVELDGNSAVGDGLVRAWSREARNNNAFSVLRILRLWNHTNVTYTSIRYIHEFPALGIFDVRACGIEDGLAAGEVVEAVRLGWREIFDVEICNAVERECLLSSKRQETAVKPPTGLMWPGSKIYRVERVPVPECAAEPKPSTNLYNSADIASSPPGSKGDGDGLTLDDSMINDWVSIDYKLYKMVTGGKAERRGWKPKPWESYNSMCWALLGHARQDNDLINAGIKGVTKAARAEDHIISPVPVAHIRLGERPFTDAVSLYYWKKWRGLVLIRVAMPAPTPVMVKPQQGGRTEERKPGQKQPHLVRRSKKRKLEGFLEELDGRSQ